METILKMTDCIHRDKDEHHAHGSPSMPLYDASLFTFNSTQAMRDVIKGKTPGFFYSRYGMNPTIEALEKKLALLDNAEYSLAFSSGMAAIAALFMQYARSGILCVGDVYGGTRQLLTEQLPALGIETQLLSDTDLNVVKETIAVFKPGLLFLETPSNPTLQVQNIRQLAELAHVNNALLAVDNTFATPVNQRPLELNADFTIQSATKYLGGHSDLTAGVISGRKDLLIEIKDWRKNLGQTIATEVAHKLLRSLLTLVLRIERHNHNAWLISEYLEQHPLVRQVCYPGLSSHEHHMIAKEQMSGFGGMLSFYIAGDKKMAECFVDALELFAIAPSLGGVESLVVQPIYSSHYGLPDEVLKASKVDGSLIRLSVGLEDVEDLKADLDHAFKTCKQIS